MTDVECWDLVLKFDPLIKSQAKNLVPKQYYEDCVQELRIIVFKGLRNGYAERGSMKQIIEFSRQRARNLVVSKIPVVTVPLYILQGMKLYKQAYDQQSLSPLRGRIHDRGAETLRTINIVVPLALSYGAYVWHIEPNDERIKDPDSNSDIDNIDTVDMADHILDQLMKIKGHPSKMGIRGYIFARYYDLEEKILEKHEDAMGDYGVLLRDVVEEQILLKEEARLKGLVQVSKAVPSKYNAAAVAEEVCLSRERVRQVIERGCLDLSEKVD